MRWSDWGEHIFEVTLFKHFSCCFCAHLPPPTKPDLPFTQDKHRQPHSHLQSPIRAKTAVIIHVQKLCKAVTALWLLEMCMSQAVLCKQYYHVYKGASCNMLHFVSSWSMKLPECLSGKIRNSTTDLGSVMRTVHRTQTAACPWMSEILHSAKGIKHWGGKGRQSRATLCVQT